MFIKPICCNIIPKCIINKTVQTIKAIFLCVMLSLLGHSMSYAQNQAQQNFDSLINELPKYQNDTNKINIWIKLSVLSYNIDPDKGIEFGKQALHLATSLGWQKGCALAKNKIGVNYWVKSNFDSALSNCLEALKLQKQLDDKASLGTILSNVGLVYDGLGNRTLALQYDFEALENFENSGEKTGAAKTLGNIGTIYATISDYPKALECYYKALKITEELNDKNLIATNLGNIGNLFQYQNDYKKALDNYEKAKEIFEILGNKTGVAMNLRNMGYIYSQEHNYNNALANYFSGLKIYEKQNDSNGIATNLGDIGTIYLYEKDYANALENDFKALKILESLGAKEGIATNLTNIGEIYLEIAKNKEHKSTIFPLVPSSTNAQLQLAKQYLTRAIILCKEINFGDALIEATQNLAEVYSLTGDYKNAIINFKEYMATKDSVYSTKNKVLLSNLETARDLELKDKDIELKDKQILIDQLEVAKKRNERVYFLIGISLLLLIIWVIFKNYKRQKLSNKLLNLEKQKSDDLLLNILPMEVAEELKNKGKAEARLFDLVTVIMTDFKGFTYVAERMTTQQLVNELDTCFKAFDEIIGKYNIEKIKTVGDAYLAVSGLPNADPEHALKVMRAAIEIKDFIAERKKRNGDLAFDVRIGVHSGSVVAGIVGLKKFAYDIWGDTVNIAARMEQNCEPGKINISQSTYNIIKDRFHCTFRGELNVKNKGMMNMYFVDTEIEDVSIYE